MSVKNYSWGCINLNLLTVNDLEGKSTLELLLELLRKMNRLEEDVDSITSMTREELTKLFKEWKEDGTLASLLNDQILVKAFEREGNEIDDTGRLQRAIKVGEETGLPVVLEPHHNYQVSKMLSIDLSKTCIHGEGADVDFGQLDEKLYSNAIHVNCTGVPPYHHNHKAHIIDLGIKGKRGCTGIYFGSSASGVGVAHITLDRLNIRGCNVGIKTGEHTYLIRMHHTDIFDCGTGVDITYAGDSGENIILDGCALYNSTTCLKVANPNTSINLINTSMDYSNVSIHCVQGNIKATQCHIEGCGQLIIEDNSGADVVLNGCTLVMVDKTFPPYVVNGRGRLLVKDGFISGGNYDGVYKDIVSGGGYVKFINNNSYDICDHFMQFYQDTDELVKLIASGEGDSTDIWTNNNCKITIDSANAETNNFCYKIAKTYGEGSQSGVQVYIPMTSHRVAIRVRVKAQTQMNVPVEISYVRTIDHQPETKIQACPFSRKQVIGDATHTIGTEWQWITIITNSMRKPGWCNAIMLNFNFFALYQSVIYIDRVNVNTY